MAPVDNLPDGFSSRPATLADLERVVEFTNAFANSVIGSDETNLDRTRAQWEAPDFDPRLSVRLVENQLGDLVGAIEVTDTSEIPVDPWVVGHVDPDHEKLGIGSYLVAWAERRAAQVIPRVPPEARVAIRVGVYHGHKPSEQLLTDRGYRGDRFFWRMTIDLQAPPKSPIWPDGIQLRPFDRPRDAEAVYRAEDEAFEDHWGHVPESFEVGFKRWSHSSFHETAYDPELWFIAWDGDRIAGLARARPQADHDLKMGWIRTLSVRRPWRRRGLAQALLLHALAEFRRRGTLKVGLGVDGRNPTGATRLYEKAGMKIALRYDIYAKELRPGKDLMTLSDPE